MDLIFSWSSESGDSWYFHKLFIKHVCSFSYMPLLFFRINLRNSIFIIRIPVKSNLKLGRTIPNKIFNQKTKYPESPRAYQPVNRNKLKQFYLLRHSHNTHYFHQHNPLLASLNSQIFVFPHVYVFFQHSSMK